MSLDWATWPEADSARVVLVVIFLVVLAKLLLGADRPRPSAIRLASPAFVALDAHCAEQLASDLGAAFREYLGPGRDRSE
jgi:hypothetical protein